MVYIDSIMRNHSHAIDVDFMKNMRPSFLTEQETENLPYEQKCERALVQIFRFLQAKEIFITTYVQFLADRLLTEQSRGGLLKEGELVSLFKNECGDAFASQTEQMISDVFAKSDYPSSFKSKKMKPGQTYNFWILDDSKWPINLIADRKINFPRQMKGVLEEFTQYYETNKRQNKGNEKQSNGKKKAINLTWDIRYGQCVLSTCIIGDQATRAFTVSASCLHGLLLL